ncbi:hypothetical protein HDU80_009553 [Chytriomyces hyalinus]|nr:hypothetical protein HDU80_009553 [Chytriomyces hyalinus]
MDQTSLTSTAIGSLVDSTATTDALVSTTASSNSTTSSTVPPNAGPLTTVTVATVNAVPSNPGPAPPIFSSIMVNTEGGASNPTNARTQLNTTNLPAATRTDATASQTNQTTSNGSTASVVIGIAGVLAVFLAIVGAVVVRKKKLPPTANKRAHKKRYIGRTDFSNSTEYFADTENGPSNNDTSNDDNDFDVDLPQAPKPIQQQQQHEPLSPDFSWPFATPRTVEETSDDTVVAQRGLMSESEDGTDPARDLARKPSFELMQDTTTSAKNASEAFTYFGFGSNRLPTLHPLPMTGVQVTSGEFEYATVSLRLPAGANLDQYAGEACFTDSGETDSATAQRDVPNSSNSSIIKHVVSSPPIAVISENPLERKVSEKGVIDE